MTTPLLWSGPSEGPVLALAHGAGAGMETAWMTTVAGLLGDRGIRVARFEFGYMAARRTGGSRAVPRAESVIPEYAGVVAQLVAETGGPVAIGGKSMGGRVASMLADAEHAAGRVGALVCLGYPFHPPGRPDALRTAHLHGLRTPALIVQGTRDPFGTREEVEADPVGYALSPAIRMLWLDDGEHELRPRVKISGHTHAEHLAAAADAVAEFVRSHAAG
jgi:uncharacterized protein